jgi:TPR repeat protein
VEKDYVGAVNWYLKAAEQSLAEAQTGLGRCYHEGQGVAKDSTEAVRWYRKAAEQNYGAAQYNLGFCYASGEGVAKDYVEAYKWWLLAAVQGLEDAKRGVTKLRGRMSPEHIAAARQLAQDFKPGAVPAAEGDGSGVDIA